MSEHFAAIDIERTRGDTFPITFRLKDDAGVAIDITGFSFTLTVDPQENPPDALGNLFALTGVLSNPTAGEVQFSPTAGEADQTPAEYFYDVQMTDVATDIRTIAKGKFIFTQDITK